MRIIVFGVLLAGLGLAGFAVHMARGYVGSYQAALVQERLRSRAADPLRRASDQGGRATGALARERRPRRRLPGRRGPLPRRRRDAHGPPRHGARRGDPRRQGDRTRRGRRRLVAPVDRHARLRHPRRRRLWRLGLLRPGDRVDVYWTGQVGNGDLTELIQAGLRIVAIDQSADQDHTSPVIARTITVEADPQEVARLAQAQSTDRLSLALVGAADDTRAVAEQVDQRKLLGIRQEQVVEAQPERECTIRTRRGGEVAVTVIPCTD